MPRPSEPSPYVEFDRRQWRALRMATPLKLTASELLGLRGMGEQIDILEVEEVYLPLARLIHLQVAARQRLHNGGNFRHAFITPAVGHGEHFHLAASRIGKRRGEVDRSRRLTDAALLIGDREDLRAGRHRSGG